MKILKRMAPYAVIVAVALLLLYLPDRGPERYTDLATFFRTELKRQGIAGYTVAVVKDGSVLYVDAFGKDGKGSPLTADTPLCIGPVSKSFTGLACLALVREGKLDLDAPVRTYLPWFSISSVGPDRNAATVTLRHLLSRTSGVSDRDFDDAHADALDLESAVRSLTAAMPRTAPGTEVHYLDTDYQALGLIIERISVASYADFIMERIFKPLGMEKSSADPTKVAGAVPPFYGSIFGAAVAQRRIFPVFGAPSDYIVSTAADMAKYMSFLTAPEKKKRPPLSPKALPTLFQPLISDSKHAFGWRIEGQGQDLAVYAEDPFGPFTAEAALWPSRRDGVAIFATQNSYIFSRFALPALIEGARSILVDGEAARLFPLARLSLLFAIAASIQILFLAIQTGDAVQWAREARGHAEAVGGPGPIRFARFRTVVGIVVRIAALVVAPAIVSAMLGRKVDWNLAFRIEPGFAGWLVAFCFFGLLRNVTRLAWLRGARQPGPSSKKILG